MYSCTDESETRIVSKVDRYSTYLYIHTYIHTYQEKRKR